MTLPPQRTPTPPPRPPRRRRRRGRRRCRWSGRGGGPGRGTELGEMSLVLCPPFVLERHQSAAIDIVRFHCTLRESSLCCSSTNSSGPLADPRIEENINQGGVEFRSQCQHWIYGIHPRDETYILLNHQRLL